jgi:aminoglycoside 3-N-acetyltransferase
VPELSQSRLAEQEAQRVTQTTVTAETIRDGLRELGLQGRDVAVHSSLRSLGHVDGGPESVVQALLDVCGTVLMPAFCEIGRTNPPSGDRPPCNGWDYDNYRMPADDLVPFDPSTFGPASGLNVEEMGRIAESFLSASGTIRSAHPSASWAANGPRAGWYAADHIAEDPNLPLKRLAEQDGLVLLLGVPLSSCTAVHLAEETAGRRPFIRWVLHTDGTIRRVREYGCADGFPGLAPTVEPHARRATIGACSAVAYPIRALVEALALAIREHPEATLCGSPDLCRCQDAVRGGPR